jgi:hypothetical protein
MGAVLHYWLIGLLLTFFGLAFALRLLTYYLMQSNFYLYEFLYLMVSRALFKISSSKGMRWKYTTKYSTWQCALVLLAWVVIAYSNVYLPCLWIISCTILKIKLSIYACTHAFVLSHVCRSFFTGKLCVLDLEYSLLFFSFYRTYSPESSSSSCGLYGSSSRLLLWYPNPIHCKIYLLVL